MSQQIVELFIFLYTFDFPYTGRNIIKKDDLTSFHRTSWSRITIRNQSFSGLLSFGARSQNCEKRLLASSSPFTRLSVRPHGTTRLLKKGVS